MTIIATVKTQSKFRICEIMKTNYQNKLHTPALPRTCGARRPPSFPPFWATAAATARQVLVYKKKKPRPIEVLWSTQKHPADNREHSKPFQAIQTWGGYQHCRWDPNLWQENGRRFCWQEKALSRWGLPPSVQYATLSLWKLPIHFLNKINLGWHNVQWPLPQVPFEGDGASPSKWRATSISAKLPRTGNETTCSTVRHCHGEFVRFFLRLR